MTSTLDHVVPSQSHNLYLTALPLPELDGILAYPGPGTWSFCGLMDTQGTSEGALGTLHVLTSPKLSPGAGFPLLSLE